MKNACVSLSFSAIYWKLRSFRGSALTHCQGVSSSSDDRTCFLTSGWGLRSYQTFPPPLIFRGARQFLFKFLFHRDALIVLYRPRDPIFRALVQCPGDRGMGLKLPMNNLWVKCVSVPNFSSPGGQMVGPPLPDIHTHACLHANTLII